MKFIEAVKNKKIGTTHKLKSYYDAYDFHFGQLDREKKYNILEIGVQDGGGLWTLKEYFFNSSITGLDVEENCKKYESKDDDVEVFIGDQEDVVTLEKIHKDRGPFDIIIDDGGHTMKQQIISFYKLFPLINNNGIYIIEDLHTSYWPKYGGGTTERFRNNFIAGDVTSPMDAILQAEEDVEHSFISCYGYRNKRDSISESQTTMGILKWISEKITEAWASRAQAAGKYRNLSEVDYFDEHVDSVHFHDSVCFIYKKYRENLDEFVKNYKQLSIRL